MVAPYKDCPEPRELPKITTTAMPHTPRIVLIWSAEHQAWWRPDAAGYTTCREEAGRYWIEDAEKRTSHCGPEKQIYFEIAASSPERWKP